VITAVVMIALLYLATAWLSVPAFALALTAMLVVATWEWATLAGERSPVQRILLSGGFLLLLAASVSVLGMPGEENAPDRFGLSVLSALALSYWLLCLYWVLVFPKRTAHWDRPVVMRLMAVLSLLPVWWALVFLKALVPSGYLVFALIALVSVADIGAYFSGRAWGRAKLAPLLSPGKSWAGFWGGMLCCLLMAMLLLALLQYGGQPLPLWLWPLLMLSSAALAAASVLGDLFESMLKRQRGIKDSGRILPGHGGVLDRIDSLLPSAPVFVIGVLLYLQATGQ